jgi:hypothetical protein
MIANLKRYDFTLAFRLNLAANPLTKRWALKNFSTSISLMIEIQLPVIWNTRFLPPSLVLFGAILCAITRYKITRLLAAVSYYLIV